MAAGAAPRPVRDHSELIHALVRDEPGAREAALVLCTRGSADAESFFTALKDASERHLVSDPATAERLAIDLAQLAEHAQQSRAVVLGWLAQADAIRVQGRFPEAIALYDRCADAYTELGDQIGWARSRTGWVFAAHFAGRGREALRVAEQAYGILAGADEHQRAGSLSNNMATVLYELGEYDRALALYDRAIAHFQQLHAREVAQERTAKATANKALALTFLGRFDQAVELCMRAREMFASLGEVTSALRVDQFRASIYAGQGQLTRALRVQSEALAEFERAGLHEYSFEVGLEMVGCYAGLNRHRDALRLAEEIAQRCEALGAPTEAAKARFRAAQAMVALDQPQRALAVLEVAANGLSSAGLAAELGACMLLRARLQLAQANWTEALSLADEACSLFTERGLAERRAQAELVRAQATLALGQPLEAEKFAQSALATARQLDALMLAHVAHHVLGTIAEARRAPRRALSEYEAAVGDLEHIQSSLTTELRAEFLGDKLRVFHDAIECALKDGQHELAFGYLERAKSRALVDALGSTSQLEAGAASAVEQQLADELARLREEHAWFYGRLHGYGAAGQTPIATDAERVMLQAAVAERERRIVHLQDRLALLRDHQHLESTSKRAQPPRPPTPEPGAVVVEYMFWEDRGAAFVVSDAGLRVEPLRVGAASLRRSLRRWQLTLDSAAEALGRREPLDGLTHAMRGQLRTLYDGLLEPVRQYLESAERVIIVPYGWAHALPFHAFYDGDRFLTEEVEVWVSPSSSLLELCAQRRRPRSAQALVVGFDGGTLPYVTEEARSIGALLNAPCYIDTQATRARVLLEASGRRIVHLAAHAEARLDNPRFAHITLADGQLAMTDVLKLRLDGALVTLSGCETGRSAVVGGDELVGLSRGFLFAGTSTLVQSLWRVDDRTTAQLMAIFYSGMAGSTAPGAALRAAQCQLIQAGTHPYLWAPFQLVGFGGTPAEAPATQPPVTEVRARATTSG